MKSVHSKIEEDLLQSAREKLASELGISIDQVSNYKLIVRAVNHFVFCEQVSVNSLMSDKRQQFVSVKEAAQMLGESERTIQRWCKSGKLKSVQPEKKYKVFISSILELMKKPELQTL